MKTTKMKSRQIVGVGVIFLTFLLGMEYSHPLYAVTNDDLFTAIENNSPSFNFQDTVIIHVRRADPSDSTSYLDFLPNPIEKTFEITGSGKTSIDYSSAAAQTADADGVEFGLTVGDGSRNTSHHLKFAKETSLSGGYAAGGIIVLDGGDLTFAENATLSKNTSTGDGGALSTQVGDEVITFTKNAILSNNYAESSGGAIAMYSAVMNVGGTLTVENNTADGEGGGIYIDNFGNESRLTITGETKLTGNRALGGSGGGLYANNAVLNFKALTADSNLAGEIDSSNVFVGAGNGGVLSLDSSQVKIDGTALFTKNQALNGGAVYGNMSTINFNENAVFGGATAALGNKSEDGGGALYFDDSSITFAKNATFQNNSVAVGDGGAVYMNIGSAIFNGKTDFLNNKADASSGGAVYLSSVGDVSADTIGWHVKNEMNFTGNSAAQGGAMYIDFDSYVVFDSASKITFGGTNAADGNKATGDGGAMYLNSSTVAFNTGSNVTASQNSAANGGFAFIDSSSNVSFNGTTNITNNSASVDGGAFYVNFIGTVDPDPSVMELGLSFSPSTTISKNKATERGGAFFVTDSAIGFNGGIIGGPADADGNTAKEGGAFYLDGSLVSFSGTTTVSNNKATDTAGSGGGAFRVGGDSIIRIEADANTTLSDNSAPKGGAVSIEDGAELTLITEAEAGTKKGGILNITAGTGSKNNDVSLGDGSILNLNTGAKSSMTFASDLSTDPANTAYIIKDGEGTVYIDGDASRFNGNLTINQGDFYIGKAGTFGNTTSTEIEINAGGSLVLDVGDSVVGNADNSRVYANLLTLNGPRGATDPPLIAAKALNDSVGGSSYNFITLDGDVKTDLENYINQNDISGYYDFLTFNSNVNYDSVNDKTTLSVGLTYNPANHDWTFNLPRLQDEFTLNAQLNDTNKKLTVTGKGTLTLASADTAGALAGDGNLVLNNTLTVNGNSSNPLIGNGGTAYDGTISGAGKFVKDGDYTQKLTGKNSYVGGTEVKNGVLSGNTDSLQGNIQITSPGILEFDQNTLASANKEGTYTGNLSGTGTLRINDKKVGESADKDSLLWFSGNSAGLSGDTEIKSGWLALTATGNLSNSNITVFNNGGLGGNGTAGHVAVESGGVLQAYQGTLNLGSLEFASGGILYVLVDGANANVIDVAGKATIDGTRVKIVGVSNYEQNTEYTFIDADEFEGTFANTSDKFSEGGRDWNFEFKQANNGKSYYATGKYSNDPGPAPVPTPAGLSWNRAQTSRAVDNYLAAYPNGLTGLTGFIKDLNKHKTEAAGKPAEYDDIYRDAANQLAGSVRLNGLQLGLYSPYRTIFNRLSLGSELFSGTPIIYNNGYGPISGINYRGAGVGSETYRGQYEQVNPHLMDEGVSCDIPYNPMLMGENNFWADVTHVQTKTKSDGNSDAYGISRTGLLIGMDVQRRPDARLGFLFGYFAPYLWQNDDRVEADDYHFGMYLQKNYLGTDIYGYFGYAHQEFESRRYVDMSQVNNIYSRERYNGKTSGDNFNMSVEISKPRYYGNNIILRPLIGLDYIYAAQYGYWDDPSGSNLFRLRYDRADYNQVFVRLGLNLKRETFRSTTNFRIQYINQFGENPYPDSRAQLTSAYRTPNTDMNIRGVNLGHDYLNLGFGLNLFTNEARSRYVSFDYDLNMSRRTTAHGLSLILVERF